MPPTLRGMNLTVKDGAASIATALVVLVFAAVHESWNIWLVGDSVRWAAAVIGVLGMVSCALGNPGEMRSRVLSALGVLAGIFLAWSLITGSMTALSLLVVADVALWLGTTARHARHEPTPLPH